jgi:hypothetical protein
MKKFTGVASVSGYEKHSRSRAPMVDVEAAKILLEQAIALLRQASGQSPPRDARQIQIITAQLSKIAQQMK